MAEVDSEWWQQEALQHSGAAADPGQLPEVLHRYPRTSEREKVERSEAQLCQVRFQHLSAATVDLRVASQTEGRTGRQARQPGELACWAEEKTGC